MDAGHPSLGIESGGPVCIPNPLSQAVYIAHSLGLESLPLLTPTPTSPRKTVLPCEGSPNHLYIRSFVHSMNSSRAPTLPLALFQTSGRHQGFLSATDFVSLHLLISLSIAFLAFHYTFLFIPFPESQAS